MLGNASDGEGAAQLVQDSEANTGLAVEQVIGDTAYGGMPVRQSLGEREVIAPSPMSGGYRTVGGERQLAKAAFEIDVENDLVRCPAGQETRQWQWTTSGAGENRVRVKQFVFPHKVCQGCELRAECVRDKWRRGRRIVLPPQEAQLQAARALAQTEYFKETYRQRVVVEHRLARLVRLGMRQARYFGRAKTLVQLLLAATVANLTLVAGKVAHTKRRGGEGDSPSALLALRAAANWLIATLSVLFGRWWMTRVTPAIAATPRRGRYQ